MMTMKMLFIIACALLVGHAAQAATFDDVLQVLAWSMNATDYHQSIDYAEYTADNPYFVIGPDRRVHYIFEGNPALAGDRQAMITARETHHAFIEIVPAVLKQPWSTLVLAGLILVQGEAIVENNEILGRSGEGIRYALAFRVRW